MTCELVAKDRHSIDRATTLEVRLNLLRCCPVIDLEEARE